MKASQIAIIIPGLNESKHISEVIKKTNDAGFKNIIFVDDGSSDKTAEIAVNPGAYVLSHKINLGKGAALRTGVEFAIKEGYEYLVFMDSDGQHDPKDIPRFLTKLETADIVYGYRTLSGQMPFLMRIGNWGITLIQDILFQSRIKDTQCGFRAIRSDAYSAIKWNARDYTVESEMLARAGMSNLRGAQVGIRTIYHDAYKGTNPFDGVKIVFNLIMLRFIKR